MSVRVDAGSEPRDSSVAELALLLTVAHLRANAPGLGAAMSDSSGKPPTGARAELRFLTGAAVVILSRRDNIVRS